MMSLRHALFGLFSRNGLILAWLFVLLIAGLLLLSVYASSEQTHRQNERMLAEQLRLISQQIPKVIYDIERQKSDEPFVRLPRASRDELQASIESTDEIITALKEGGVISMNDFRTVTIAPLRSTEARFALEKIDSIWHAYKPQLVLVWNARDSLSAVTLSNIAWTIGDYHSKFFHAASALLAEIDYATNAQHARLRLWQMGLIFLSAIVFLLFMLHLLRRWNELQTKLLHLESNQTLNKTLHIGVEDVFKLCFEYSTNLIFQVDGERKLLSANPALCNRLEYSATEVLHLRLDDLIAEDHRTHFQTCLDSLIHSSEKSTNIDVVFVSKTGRRVLAEGVMFATVHDGGEVRFQGIFEDVTEIRRIESEVSDLYHNAPCGYYSLDSKGYFTRINDTALRWLGYEQDELIGKKRFTDLLSAESRASYAEHLKKFRVRTHQEKRRNLFRTLELNGDFGQRGRFNQSSHA